jgi:FAS-associated factor 2
MVTLDTLDEEQKVTLSQYQTITETKDLDEALGQLIEHGWDLRKAIEYKYEANHSGTAREELEKEVADSNIASTLRKRHTTSMTSNSSATATPPPTTNIPPSLNFMSILLWPFGIAWNITWSILSFASRIWFQRQSITAHREPRDARVLAYEFKQTFESKHGKRHVEFFQGGYSQALEKARKELKFLLVILQSDDHDDTDLFCKETLTSRHMIDYLKEKSILVWGGNVKEAESHKVSYTLQATAYPFMALIGLQKPLGSSSPKMTVIERIEGPCDTEELIHQLDAAIDRHGAVLNRLKNERDQRELERQLRDDQDKAYRESLKADQEKARKAQEEKDALAKAEEEERQRERDEEMYKQKKEVYIRYLYTQLPQEPKEGKMTKLSFRLADGDRVVRLFSENDNLETLYRFVEVYPLLKANEHVEPCTTMPEDYTHKYLFKIHSPYPRMEYESDKDKKLADIPSLWPSATLVVDAVDDDEEV